MPCLRRIQLVDSLPLTAHGKTDRARLAELWLELGRAAGETPAEGRAVSKTEELLAALSADALERADVGREEPFLDLGGDSSIPPRSPRASTTSSASTWSFVAGNPTVASMAASMDGARGAKGEERVAQARQPSRMFVQPDAVLAAGARVDSPTRSIMVRLEASAARFDLDALRRSLELLIDRHEILRTWSTGSRTNIAAHVGETARVVDDLADDPRREARISELIELERLRPALGEGPLHRWRFIRLGQPRHRLLRPAIT